VKTFNFHQIVMMALGCVLFFTPWIWSFPMESAESRAAVIAGSAVVVFAGIQLLERRVQNDLVLFVIGLLTALAPLVLPMPDWHAKAADIAIGVVVALFAGWILRTDPAFKKWVESLRAAT